MSENPQPICNDCGAQRIPGDKPYRSVFVNGGSYVFCPTCAEKRGG